MVESAEVETVPVAPLVPPVTVSPTVKSVLGMITLKVVVVATLAIVVSAPLVRRLLFLHQQKSRLHY